MSKVKALLIFAILAGGCSHHAEKSAPADRKAQIEGEITAATAALAAAADPVSGWPSASDCDGTLWAGLACAGGYPVDIDRAEYEPGVIHRRPAPSCWDHGDRGSKSTVSGDMLLGYLWCRWARRDLAALQRLAAYGEAHSWVMGEPASEIGRVLMKPNMIALLGRALYALGADNGERHSTELYLPVSADYERHLQALAIVLHGEVTEGESHLVDVPGDMLQRLRELAAAEPENPGFATALGIYTGDMSRAVDLFLSPDTPVPTYVRGDRPEAFAAAERLFWLTKAHARMGD